MRVSSTLVIRDKSSTSCALPVRWCLATAGKLLCALPWLLDDLGKSEGKHHVQVSLESQVLMVVLLMIPFGSGRSWGFNRIFFI